MFSRSVLYTGLLSICLWYSMTCSASTITIDRADLILKNDVYHLDTVLQYKLGDGAAYQALVHGIALYFHIKVQITQERAWLWDKEIMDRLLIFKLQYSSLSEEYIVSKVNTGKRHSFKTLEYALSDMGTIKNLPFFDKMLLDKDNTYNITMQAFVDIESLPAPMRPIAYTSAEWRALSSTLYSWAFKP